VASKLTKGILDALDERLGTKILGAEGRTLTSGAKVLSKAPVRGILAKPVDPASVHPDFLKPGPPLEEMYHGTNRRVNYGRPGSGFYNDVGLHLTGSPEVADYYALNYDTPDLNLLKAEKLGKIPGFSLAGPRTYPMYVDPGKTLDFPGDAVKWTDPHAIADVVDEFRGFGTSPELEELYSMLRGGKSIEPALRDLGYDSMRYKHVNPYEWIVEEPALMLTDSSRAVPKYSSIGQEAAKMRGVLAAKPSGGRSAEEISGEIGPKGVAGQDLTPDQFISTMWNPTQRQLMDEIDKGGLEEEFGIAAALKGNLGKPKKKK
jgi:hypothetical protein